MEKKVKLKITNYEKNILIIALNDYRNKLIKEDKSVVPINELLVKIIY